MNDNATVREGARQTVDDALLLLLFLVGANRSTKPSIAGNIRMNVNHPRSRKVQIILVALCEAATKHVHDQTATLGMVNERSLLGNLVVLVSDQGFGDFRLDVGRRELGGNGRHVGKCRGVDL